MGREPTEGPAGWQAAALYPFTSPPPPPPPLLCLPAACSVIHQPSSEVFALFDKLCLLSDGHVVYFGAANRAIDFFEAAGMGVPNNRNPGGWVKVVGVRGQGCGRGWDGARPGLACLPLCTASAAHLAVTPGPPTNQPPVACPAAPLPRTPAPCAPPLRPPSPAADHFLHTINRDFLDSADVETNIQTLVAQYKASNIQHHVKEHVAALQAGPGQPYQGGTGAPGWGFQTSILTHRTFLNK